MKTKIETYHRLEHGRKVTIPAGLPVVRADNLPADSKIKYWLADCPPKADDEVESHWNRVGFGFTANEVESPGLRAHYESRPIV